MLRLVTNGKFLQFGDKILEHMRMFSDPEKLLSMQLLEAGTEEWVASGLLGLLHLLPWEYIIIYITADMCSRFDSNQQMKCPLRPSTDTLPHISKTLK